MNVDMKRRIKEAVIIYVKAIVLAILILIGACVLLSMTDRGIIEPVTEGERYQWLEGKHGSSGDLKEVIKDGLGIKGVSCWGWTYPSMMSFVTAGICVCRSSHADLTALSLLFTSRGSIGSYSIGSIRLGSRLFNLKSLPSTGPRVKAIKLIKHIKGITF